MRLQYRAQFKDPLPRQLQTIGPTQRSCIDKTALKINRIFEWFKQDTPLFCEVGLCIENADLAVRELQREGEISCGFAG